VLLARRRIEKDREVASDRDVAGGAQLVGIGADDDPVAIAARQPEQFVTHGTADEIALHRSMLSRLTGGYLAPTDGRSTPTATGCSRRRPSLEFVQPLQDRAAIRSFEEL